jgi:hypothetical protein
LCPEGFDPNSGICNNQAHQLFNVFLNQPYPFNQMPSSGPAGMNPFSQGLLGLFPQPNSGSNIFLSTQTLTDNTDQFGVRVDHYLTQADNLNFRYMFSNGSRLDPLSPSGASVKNFVAQETHDFSPALIGVLRFSYLRNKFLFDEHINHTTPASLGFRYSPSLDPAIGPPFIQVNGYTNVGDPITGPRNTYEDAFDYSGSLSWVRGAHELKFGGGYQHLEINAPQGIATNGFFVFVPFPVTDAFASFLWGQPIVFLQGRGDFSRGIRETR